MLENEKEFPTYCIKKRFLETDSETLEVWSDKKEGIIAFREGVWFDIITRGTVVYKEIPKMIIIERY